MRVACCISGHPRFLKECYPYFYGNVLASNNPDIFIHFWDVWDKSGVCREEQNIDFITSLYKPKKIIIEPDNESYAIEQYAEQVDFIPNYRKRIHSMLNSLMLADRLKKDYEKEQGFTYDWSIRYRTDLHLDTAIYLQNYDSSFLWLCDHHCNHEEACDLIAFSNSKVMDTFSNCYLSLTDYKQYMYNKWNKVAFGSERILDFHLKRNNIPMSLIHLNISRYRGV